MKAERYRKPVLKQVVGQTRTLVLSHNFTVVPSQRTIVLGPIPYAFVIEQITLFSSAVWSGAEDVYFLVSRNRAESTTGVPSGDNLFGKYGSSARVLPYTWNWPFWIPLDYEVAAKGMYLKVHVNNRAGGFGEVYFAFTVRELT